MMGAGIIIRIGLADIVNSKTCCSWNKPHMHRVTELRKHSE